MSLYLLFVLAIVQGITEFLPISSSAHLALLHQMSGTTSDDLALDIAVHIGSIIAVILYLREEAFRAFRGLFRMHRYRQSHDGQLALGLVIATVPAVVVGLILKLTGLTESLRTVQVIGWTMIIFGIALYVVHRVAPESRREADWSLRTAITLGLWQAISLVPGVSRSGITMTAARSMGYERHTAARMSMLMSIPITLASGVVLALDVVREGVDSALFQNAAIAAVLSFFAAYGALILMMKFLSRVSFTPYVIYRLALGVVLLGIAYW
jgi:undecaprenyl-diphosphatase